MAEAKFKVGDTVHCFRQETEAFWGFDFVGQVEWVNLVDDDEYEYRVSNAPPPIPGYSLGFPLLIWESEMTLVET